MVQKLCQNVGGLKESFDDRVKRCKVIEKRVCKDYLQCKHCKNAAVTYLKL